eukprot:933856-Rhodomonas_salina.1
MRKIGELWRNMPPEERERYAQEAQAAHEQAQAQQAAMAQHYGNPYAHQQVACPALETCVGGACGACGGGGV